MNAYKAVAIITSAMWLGCALAISVAIYFTRDVRCLFFFLIPAFTGYNVKVRHEEE